MQEMAVREDWTGKTLRQLELRQKYGISVIALHDMLTDQIIAAPDPDAVLKESDTLLVAGKDEDLARAARQD
jgi:trk system potassium uptake protein TrkA